jgi:hypothetical protein
VSGARGLVHHIPELAVLKVSHHTDERALDEYIAGDLADIEQRLEQQGGRGRWALRALRVWRTLDAVRRGHPCAVNDLTDEQAREWGPQLVDHATARSVEAAWQLVEQLLERPQDFWSMADLAAIVARGWNAIFEHPKAEAWLARLLGDRERYGAYVLLEPLLAQQLPPEQYYWTHLRATITALARAPHGARRELALVFDGLLWRKPCGVPHEEYVALLRCLVSAAKLDSALWGAYAMTCAYHPPGVTALLDAGLPDPQIMTEGLTRDQAREVVWLTQWHLLHQSRARALATRRNYTDDDMRYLGGQLHRQRAYPDHAQRVMTLVRRVAQHEGCEGWAIHLAINARMVLGMFESDEYLAALLAKAPIDDGTLSAAMSCAQFDEAMGEDFVELFAGSRYRNALLDRLGSGLRIDDQDVRPPRFRVVADVSEVWAEFGIAWSQLETLNPPLPNREQLLLAFEAAAFELDDADAEIAVTRFRGGDWRLLEAFARPERAQESGAWTERSYHDILIRCAESIRDEREQFEQTRLKI